MSGMARKTRSRLNSGNERARFPAGPADRYDRDVTSAADLLSAVGLPADGLALLGRPVAARGPGIYLIELERPLTTAPIELTTVGKWIERVPTLRLDGEVPSSRALRARIQAFWIPSATVLFIGSAERTLAGRIRALTEHVLGDPRPHAASQWLKTLSLSGLRVRWAETPATEEWEDALLEAFARSVPDAERAALPDPSVVLPFANLRRATGERKATGITGATLPVEEPPAAPPTRVVDVPAGDADGARLDERGTGIRRRTNTAPPVVRTRRAPAAARPAAARAPTGGGSSGRPTPEPLLVTADGLERIHDELRELTTVRRPEVIDRIRRARELGDLKENSDYTSAREEQSFLEGRIQALEARLRTAVVADAPSQTVGRIGIGSKVTLEQDGEEIGFTIVGPSESDPGAGRISDASPVGRALVGASVGDEVVVKTPRGEVRYRVLTLE
jgi:transcription elongation factor GreA